MYLELDRILCNNHSGFSSCKVKLINKTNKEIYYLSGFKLIEFFDSGFQVFNEIDGNSIKKYFPFKTWKIISITYNPLCSDYKCFIGGNV